MSVKALSWAFDQPIGGNEKVVLLVLADFADEKGRAYPGQATIATKAHIVEKTVGRVIRKLEEGGYLRREERRRPDGSRTSDLYHLAVNGQTDVLSGGSADPAKQTPTHARGTEPSGEPSGSLVARANDERKRITVDKKLVPVVIQVRAERVLAHYCEKTGRQLRAYTATGKASEALKRIVMRCTENPSLEAEHLYLVVDRVLANPPSWAEGTPEVGDIFGPAAFERALSNNGIPAKKNGRGDGYTAEDYLRAAEEGGS